MRPVLIDRRAQARSRRSRSAAGSCRPACTSRRASTSPTAAPSSTRTRPRSAPSASSATRRPARYAWIPFGGGVRRCVGAAFADDGDARGAARGRRARRARAPTGRRASACAARSVTLTPDAVGARDRRAASVNARVLALLPPQPPDRELPDLLARARGRAAREGPPRPARARAPRSRAAGTPARARPSGRRHQARRPRGRRRLPQPARPRPARDRRRRAPRRRARARPTRGSSRPARTRRSPTEPDAEEATWLAFLLALVAARRARAARGDRRRRARAGRAASCPSLPGADPRTAAAYRAWAERAGSQAEALPRRAGWSPERRFARVFERLALPGFGRAAALRPAGRRSAPPAATTSPPTSCSSASRTTPTTLAAKRLLRVRRPDAARAPRRATSRRPPACRSPRSTAGSRSGATPARARRTAAPTAAIRSALALRDLEIADARPRRRRGIAEAVVALQRASYRVEADLIGARTLPAAARDAAASCARTRRALPRRLRGRAARRRGRRSKRHRRARRHPPPRRRPRRASAAASPAALLDALDALQPDAQRWDGRHRRGQRARAPRSTSGAASSPSREQRVAPGRSRIVTFERRDADRHDARRVRRRTLRTRLPPAPAAGRAAARRRGAAPPRPWIALLVLACLALAALSLLRPRRADLRPVGVDHLGPRDHAPRPRHGQRPVVEAAAGALHHAVRAVRRRRGAAACGC